MVIAIGAVGKVTQAAFIKHHFYKCSQRVWLPKFNHLPPACQHGCKLINLARRAIRNARLARKTQRRKHGNLLNSRNALNARERRITNATRRHIHNATARNIVSSVRH